MKYTLILLFFVITNSLSLGTFRDGLLIDPNTNKPFTGNLEVLNNDWGNDSVEFSKNYFEGVLHGLEKSYYKSGVLRSVGKFNMGLLEGDVIGYREDGSVYVVGHYFNGVKDGNILYLYPDGSRQIEMYYDKGKLQGVVKTWYENGNLMKEEPYEKGLLHGYLKTYYESGGVFEEIKYNYGTPKIMIRYREDGTIFDQKGFIEHDLVKEILI